MSALNIIITDAGRAEHINAQNTGAGPLEITEVRLGSGQYSLDDTNKTQTALVSPIKSLTTLAGEAVADDTLHFTIKDESSDAYHVGEFGLFTASGTLYAVYSQPADQGWIIEKAAPSTLLLAVDVILESLNATDLTFGSLEFLNPPASHEIPGVVKLATTEATIAGVDSKSAVTPYGLNIRFGNVDNTKDIEKPLSLAQQAALDLKANQDGDYTNLRARATTKEDVGLSNVDNFGREHFDERYGIAGGEANQHRNNGQNEEIFLKNFNALPNPNTVEISSFLSLAIIGSNTRTPGLWDLGNSDLNVSVIKLLCVTTYKASISWEWYHYGSGSTFNLYINGTETTYDSNSRTQQFASRSVGYRTFTAGDLVELRFGNSPRGSLTKFNVSTPIPMERPLLPIFIRS